MHVSLCPSVSECVSAHFCVFLHVSVQCMSVHVGEFMCVSVPVSLPISARLHLSPSLSPLHPFPPSPPLPVPLHSSPPLSFPLHPFCPSPPLLPPLSPPLPSAPLTVCCLAGGLQAIAELLEVDETQSGLSPDPYSVTMRRYACMALTNLTFGDGTNKALLCSARAAMRALVAQLHSSSEELLQVAASVLRNLSWRADEASKRCLREVGCVQALTLAAMAARREATLKSVLSALWNLSAHCSDNKAAVCAVDGALAFLVSTLSPRCSGAATLAVVENGGGVLRNVSSHVAVREEYRAVLRAHACLPALLRHLRSPSLTVVSNACGTLWNLSARCAQDQRTLWQLGAVSMLRNLVHSRHRMISMGSAAALKNLLAARPSLAALEQERGQERGEEDGAGGGVSRSSSQDSVGSAQSDVTHDRRQAARLLRHRTAPWRPVDAANSRIVRAMHEVAMHAGIDARHSPPPPPALPGDDQVYLERQADGSESRDEPVNYSIKYSETAGVPGPGVEGKHAPAIGGSETSAFTKPETESAAESAVESPAKSEGYDTVDQPTNYSLRFAEQQEEEGIADQPTDYSARYEETGGQTAEYRGQTGGHVYDADDNLRTYCTEGTPLTATSMTDVSGAGQPGKAAGSEHMSAAGSHSTGQNTGSTVIAAGGRPTAAVLAAAATTAAGTEDEASQPASLYSYNDSSATDSPSDRVKKYCTEGTPLSFSRVSSLSSLHSGEDAPAPPAPLAPPPPPEEEAAAKAAKAGKSVTFNETPQVTPLMFSRSTSLGSLSSCEVHSVHSSVVSEYSRRASEVVSPSDLPDSPSETMPPTPRRKSPRGPTPGADAGQHDAAMVFAMEEDDTMTTSSSLSALSVDEPHIRKDSCLRRGGGGGGTAVVPPRSSLSPLQEVVPPETEPDAATADGDTSYLSAYSSDNLEVTVISVHKVEPVAAADDWDDDDDDEDELLAEVIQLAMPASRTPRRGRAHPSQPDGDHPPPATEYDIPVKFTTEDTPLNFSETASLSDISFEQTPAAMTPRHASATDDASDTSSVTSDNDDLLSEAIQAAMPQPSRRVCRRAMQRGAHCDRLTSYNVEGTPINFSRAASLSDLGVESPLSRPVAPAQRCDDSPRTYNVEDTPLLLSRSESLSSLSCDESPVAATRLVKPVVARRAGIQSPAIARLRTPLTSRPGEPTSHSTPLGLKDATCRYEVEGTPACFSHNSSLSSLNSDEHEALALTSDPAPSSPPSASCTTRLSHHGSTGSLSVESLSFEPTPSETALLQECINAAMPKGRSAMPRGATKGGHRGAHRSKGEVKGTPEGAATGSDVVTVVKLQKEASNREKMDASGCRAGVIGGEPAPTALELTTDCGEIVYCLDACPPAAAATPQADDALMTSSTTERMFAESRKVASHISDVRNQMTNSTDGVGEPAAGAPPAAPLVESAELAAGGVDIMMESFPEMSSSLISDVTSPDEGSGAVGESDGDTVVSGMGEMDRELTGDEEGEGEEDTAALDVTVLNATMVVLDSPLRDADTPLERDMSAEEEHALLENTNIILSELSLNCDDDGDDGDDDGDDDAAMQDALIANEILVSACVSDSASEMTVEAGKGRPRIIKGPAVDVATTKVVRGRRRTLSGRSTSSPPGSGRGQSAPSRGQASGRGQPAATGRGQGVGRGQASVGRGKTVASRGQSAAGRGQAGVMTRRMSPNVLSPKGCVSARPAGKQKTAGAGVSYSQRGRTSLVKIPSPRPAKNSPSPQTSRNSCVNLVKPRVTTPPKCGMTTPPKCGVMPTDVTVKGVRPTSAERQGSRRITGIPNPTRVTGIPSPTKMASPQRPKPPIKEGTFTKELAGGRADGLTVWDDEMDMNGNDTIPETASEPATLAGDSPRAKLQQGRSVSGDRSPQQLTVLRRALPGGNTSRLTSKSPHRSPGGGSVSSGRLTPASVARSAGVGRLTSRSGGASPQCSPGGSSGSLNHSSSGGSLEQKNRRNVTAAPRGRPAATGARPSGTPVKPPVRKAAVSRISGLWKRDKKVAEVPGSSSKVDGRGLRKSCTYDKLPVRGSVEGEGEGEGKGAGEGEGEESRLWRRTYTIRSEDAVAISAQIDSPAAAAAPAAHSGAKKPSIWRRAKAFTADKRDDAAAATAAKRRFGLFRRDTHDNGKQGGYMKHREAQEGGAIHPLPPSPLPSPLSSPTRSHLNSAIVTPFNYTPTSSLPKCDANADSEAATDKEAAAAAAAAAADKCPPAPATKTEMLMARRRQSYLRQTSNTDDTERPSCLVTTV